MGEKPFKFGFMIGRFQHMHIGHEHVINKALSICENLLILVGSSQESGTLRNPFDALTRIDIIKKVYENRVMVGFIPDLTNENDHSYEWGDFVLKSVNQWKTIFGISSAPDLMVYGNDEERNSWFRPESVEKISHLKLSRGVIDISATKMRQLIMDDDQLLWAEYANPKIHRYFSRLQDKLNAIPEYQRGK
ncbi:adenylyltransferase/cytidyltransferase family protein [Brevibacillus laterosporus]|uniref:adenylyltransferase/cytidyltransferase family protein n=1 Tax=Brevibacillus laterosporus TaxID=1465 RepID=UPI003D1C54FA